MYDNGLVKAFVELLVSFFFFFRKYLNTSAKLLEFEIRHAALSQMTTGKLVLDTRGRYVNNLLRHAGENLEVLSFLFSITIRHIRLAVFPRLIIAQAMDARSRIDTGK